MKMIQILAGCLAALSLVSCVSEGEPRMDKNANQKEAVTGTILFKDAMTEDWQKNWFLDGKRAVLGHTDEGLWIFCTPSGVDKRVNRAKFDSHHAVLWTKKEFEGDIRITYDFAKRGTSLLYIQAQGIGLQPYEKDIYAWRDLREVASMGKYFEYMTLRSLSFRENIRFKRYPWKAPSAGKGEDYKNVLVKPMIEYESENGKVDVGRFCRVLIESRKDTLRLRIQDADNPENVIEHTWNATSDVDPQQPVFTRNGRIGLRNMGGCWARYKNFKVEQL